MDMQNPPKNKKLGNLIEDVATAAKEEGSNEPVHAIRMDTSESPMEPIATFASLHNTSIGTENGPQAQEVTKQTRKNDDPSDRDGFGHSLHRVDFEGSSGHVNSQAFHVKPLNNNTAYTHHPIFNAPKVYGHTNIVKAATIQPILDLPLSQLIEQAAPLEQPKHLTEALYVPPPVVILPPAPVELNTSTMDETARTAQNLLSELTNISEAAQEISETAQAVSEEAQVIANEAQTIADEEQTVGDVAQVVAEEAQAVSDQAQTQVAMLEANEALYHPSQPTTDTTNDTEAAPMMITDKIEQFVGNAVQSLYHGFTNLFGFSNDNPVSDNSTEVLVVTNEVKENAPMNDMLATDEENTVATVPVVASADDESVVIESTEQSFVPVDSEVPTEEFTVSFDHPVSEIKLIAVEVEPTDVVAVADEATLTEVNANEAEADAANVADSVELTAEATPVDAEVALVADDAVTEVAPVVEEHAVIAEFEVLADVSVLDNGAQIINVLSVTDVLETPHISFENVVFAQDHHHHGLEKAESVQQDFYAHHSVPELAPAPMVEVI